MQFNKVNNPIYTTIIHFTQQEDNSISAKYIVGTGEDKDGQIVNFITICESYKYIPADKALELLNSPLTQDDLGKTPNEIMLNRIYNHLKATGEIIV